jgi:acetyltransferase
MTTMNLQRFFNPRSVAIIGASEKQGSVGYSLMKNFVESDFKGNIFPVNPNHRQVMGMACAADVAALDSGVDLAVIATPLGGTPQIVEACGIKGLAGKLVPRDSKSKPKYLQKRRRTASESSGPIVWVS